MQLIYRFQTYLICKHEARKCPFISFKNKNRSKLIEIITQTLSENAVSENNIILHFQSNNNNINGLSQFAFRDQV